jgi:hypothetical protein
MPSRAPNLGAIAFALTLVAFAAAASPPLIDRQAVVERHTVALSAANSSAIDTSAVLVVGNGAFAVNVDITGTQTLNATYTSGQGNPLGVATDLNTMAEWGWHTVPWSEEDPTFALRQFNFTYFESTAGANNETRRTPYLWGQGAGKAPANTSGAVLDWLNAHPHKLNLGQTSLRLLGASPTSAATFPVSPSWVTDAAQEQRMWDGSVSSNFTLDTGAVPPLATCAFQQQIEPPVTVTLSCGPGGDVITGFSFAAYGHVEGSCLANNLSVAADCNATDAPGIISSLCLGKPFCDVASSNTVFGDPCVGLWKGLAIRVTCGAAPVPPPPAASYSLSVTTAAHPDVDAVAFRVECTPTATVTNSTLCPLALRLAFPFGNGAWGPETSDWDDDSRHSTTLTLSNANSTATLLRTLDSDGYRVDCSWSAAVGGGGGGEAVAYTLAQVGPNTFDLLPASLPLPTPPSPSPLTLDFVCLYTPRNLHYPAGAWMDWLQAKANASRAMIGGGGAPSLPTGGSPSLPTGGAPSLSTGGTPSLPTVDAVRSASAAMWASYWGEGAFVDLASGTSDPDAFELERRVVLSQYLLRVHNAGAEPPAETGLLCNSWSGKHHLEMRFWHHGHWSLWLKPELLDRSQGFYFDLLPNATAYAAFQGYGGARWFKETASVPNRTAIDVQWLGTDFAPAPPNLQPGTLLTWEAAQVQNAAVIWQQPHPIQLADFQRRAVNATSGPAAALAAMQRLSPLVFATADFLSTFPYLNATDGRFWIAGPPLYGAEEMGDGVTMRNPTFELVQFASALDTASEWRAVLGLAPVPQWLDVAARMSSPPLDAGSDPSRPTYTFNSECACALGAGGGGSEGDNPFCPPDRFNLTQCDPLQSHPAIIGAHGMVNGAGRVDLSIANRTLAGILANWTWGSTWGWDYPLLALSQLRLGWSPESVAATLLMKATKNLYLASGHNYQSSGLPAYLPGNGGLLLAVAMMAAGAGEGAGESGPMRFPEAWGARAEGFLVPYP